MSSLASSTAIRPHADLCISSYVSTLKSSDWSLSSITLPCLSSTYSGFRDGVTGTSDCKDFPFQSHSCCWLLEADLTIANAAG